MAPLRLVRRVRRAADPSASPRLQSRGPIATSVSPPLRWRACISPRLQSRGPIATRPVASGCLQLLPLHGYKAVAPLRQRLASLLLRALAPLHGYKAVAPLRRGAPATAPPWPPGSPRLQSRGPIATSRTLGGRTGCPPLSTATKPWPHCDWASVAGVVLLTTLHGYKAVAPLRPQPLARGHGVVAALHGYKAVAPLRREHRERRHPVQRSLHGYKAVAPLRRGGAHQGQAPRHLSTATKPWPHCDLGEMAERLLVEGTSPRLQSRGPIATAATCGTCSSSRRTLHGYKAVAPLRRAGPAGGAAVRRALHGYKAVAPLRQ